MAGLSDFVNVGKINADVESAINGKINDLMGDFNASDLNPDNIESLMNSAEEKMSQFDELQNKASKAVMAYDILKNPKGAALKYGMQFAGEALSSIPQVAAFKAQAYQEIQDRIMQIPQVQKFKDEAEAFIKENMPSGIPVDLPSIDKSKNEGSSIDALITRAKHEIGIRDI